MSCFKDLDWRRIYIGYTVYS